ncbi:MAG: PAS domain S-box [Fusobacteria bacterium]|nr:MAG: PAS domain S-box [Fusobacteriota bacterium]KAF0228557.1 MAG: PAS domain [Fusobacteriota bacterium]
MKNKNILFRKIIFIVGITILCALYLRFAWARYEKIASDEAIMLAQSLEAMVQPEHIGALKGSIEDLENPEYFMTKQNLIRLTNTTKSISFAYLMAEKDGKIVILMDSEEPNNEDYSPPGQVYEEVDDLTKEIFTSGKLVLTEPSTDRWGTWISALIPVFDTTDGSVIAVFGIDYPATQWYANIWRQMIPDAIIVLCVLMLFFALLRSWSQHNRLKSLNKKMAFDEGLYHSVFTQAPIGIAISDGKYGIAKSKHSAIKINSVYEDIIGRKGNQIEHIKWTEITHPDDLQADLEKFEQFKRGEIKGYSMEKRFIRPDGSIVWTNMKLSKLLGDDDKNATHLCLLEDITKQKETESSLRESERSKTLLISKLPGMAYRCKYDEKWTMEFISDGCFKLTGYHPENILNNRDLPFDDLITPEYRKPLKKEWERILANKASFKYEYEIKTKNGERKWVLELGEGVFDENDEVISLEGIILDITDRKEVENSIRYINEHDMVTGLYNRRYLDYIFNKETIDLSSEKQAFVGINLNTIDLLSLSYGFFYSQEILKKVAEGLKSLSDDNHQLYNTYVNRFVFYTKGYKDKAELVAFCNGIIHMLESILTVERIGGGIGIVEVDDKNMYNLDEILKNVLIASEKTIASYEKDFGYSFYDKKMESERDREEKIRRELVKIAGEDISEKLFLQFQPIYDVKLDRICSFEALSRINSDELGLISPAEFIPIAEKTKFIIPLGKQIIIKSFEFLKRLEENGFKDVKVSINISAIQLLRNDFVKEFFEIIEKMQVNSNSIEIEITESIFASNYDVVNSILSELKSSGISISIDDFGTEYSSLARERELNVNCLKIDKFFIDKLLCLNEEESITSDIISMAHKMGHCVVAEGVEEEVQLEYLKEHGCDKVQGYLIAKPFDADVGIEFLKDR